MVKGQVEQWHYHQTSIKGSSGATKTVLPVAIEQSKHQCQGPPPPHGALSQFVLRLQSYCRPRYKSDVLIILFDDTTS